MLYGGKTFLSSSSTTYLPELNGPSVVKTNAMSASPLLRIWYFCSPGRNFLNFSPYVRCTPLRQSIRWRQGGNPLTTMSCALPSRSEIFVGLPSSAAFAFVIPIRYVFSNGVGASDVIPTFAYAALDCA